MNKITSIDPKNITTAEMGELLSSAVAPRPIALASTVDKSGNANLSPFSFFNVFSIHPPVLIFSAVRRVRDNTIKHTLENVMETKQVVINIVNFPIVEQMSLSSTEYGAGVNEFVKSGLTEIPSVKVKPPRVAESPVSFECEVDKLIELGEEGGAGVLVISRVVYVHVNEKYLDADRKIDTAKLDLVARLGGSWYSRLTEESLFEIPKPVRSKGIGVDALPKHVFTSKILSGNNIGRLGNFGNIPDTEDLKQFGLVPEIQEILQIPELQNRIEALHKKAKYFIEKDQLSEAVKTLFIIE